MTGRNVLLLPGTPLVALLFVLLPSAPARSQEVPAGPSAVVRGVVTAEESGLPLATGAVSLYVEGGEEALTVLTDDQGRYALPVPSPGTYRVRAERIGYHPQEKGPFTLQATDTLTVDFQLSPAPLPMDSILVSVQRRSRTLGAGEQLIYGRLLDDGTGDPIPQGLIRLLRESGSAAATTLSDDEGLFWLVSPAAGSYRLQAERIGYQTSTGPEVYLMLGDTIGLDFYLSMEALLLNPIVVRATARPLGERYRLTGMEDFLRRYSQFAENRYGEYLTRDSLAKYEDQVMSIGQLMWMTMMSVSTASTISSQVTLRSGCMTPRYYVDGLPVPPDMTVDFPPHMLEGVEVYVRPTIPAEFLQGWPCGVVALWTRRAPNPGPDVPTWQKTLLALGSLGLVFLLML